MENKEREILISKFEELFGKVTRVGASELLNFIRKSDFYTAPASSRFHGSYEGGLLEHSLNVYDCLRNKFASENLWNLERMGYTEENIIVSALLHDICKTYYYVIEMRNSKNEQGQWVKVPFYSVEDKIPLGHGSKSCFMIEEFMKLKPCERYAIRWHMGAYDVTQTESYSIGASIELHPLVLALQQADMEATYILEKERK